MSVTKLEITRDPAEQAFFLPRPYRDETDLEKMRKLLQAGRQASNGTYYVHTGDLSWWLFYPPLDFDLWQFLHIWDDPLDSEDILAWALVSPDWYTADVILQPPLRGSLLAQQMYLWAEDEITAVARKDGKNLIRVMWVGEDDHVMDEHLRQRGFLRAKEDVSMLRSFEDDIPSPTLPPGYCMRGCLGEAELEQRARAQYGSFGNTAPFERYVERWQRFMRSPVYQPELDVVAAAPDGQIGAFCITWLDPVSKAGNFEPVGTHPDFQRKGLGKAVMLEALRRLKEHGMTRAIVCTAETNTPAVRLYESVGFHVANRLGIYEKNI